MNSRVKINTLPACCKNCRYKSYKDNIRVYCGFCMKRILIELGYMKEDEEEVEEHGQKN